MNHIEKLNLIGKFEKSQILSDKEVKKVFKIFNETFNNHSFSKQLLKNYKVRNFFISSGDPDYLSVQFYGGDIFSFRYEDYVSWKIET